MSITIRRVQSKKDLREFVNFPRRLYKDMPAYVPSLYFDEIETLSPRKNPAYEFCDAALFLAEKDGSTAGRVAAIINHKANEVWNHKEVRFGWFDFIDDKEVSSSLIQEVINYGLEHGMNSITGPLGFMDFDPEGMLIEGYEHLSSMALNHNWPYYKDHMDAMGFRKEADWLEYRIYIPKEVPEKYKRIARIVEERNGWHLKKLTRREIKKQGIGYKVFDLVNETYSGLYNFTPLSKKMIDKYVGFYLGVLDLKFVSLVEDREGNIIGFGIVMPSITRALQKCGGRLFPFGWFHVLRSMYFKYEESFEMLLIGVKPEYRKMGVNSIIYCDILERLIEAGFVYGESNAELEDNFDIRSQWAEMEVDQCKRRRVFTKEI